MRTLINPTRDEFFENSEVTSNKKKYVRKKRYPYKLYIPENLDIDEILKANPPLFKYHRDCFVYITHLILSVPLWIKDFDIEDHKGFTPISKEFLSRRIHNYKYYIEYLKANKIVIEGTSYKPGYYARGLKFCPLYQTNVSSCYISKNTLIKSITERNDKRDIIAEEKLYFLKQWFNSRLTIDMNGVTAFLENDKIICREKIIAIRSKQKIKKAKIPVEEVITFGYNMKFMVADKINEASNYRLKIDSTTGRFHSPLTQLKKELRQFVRYDNQELYGLDIVNSQPLLALAVLDYDLFIDNKIYQIIAHYNNVYSGLINLPKLSNLTNSSSTMLVNLIKKCKKAKDIELFKKAVVEGDFYEFFGKLLKDKGLLPPEIIEGKEIRKYAKTATFTAFFSKIKDVIWNTHIQAFRKCFPTVFRIFTLIKVGENNHPTLACLLQRFESNIVLHKVSTEINLLYPNTPLFTVHDSIITTEENRAEILEIFKKNLFNCLKTLPKLTIEKW